MKTTCILALALATTASGQIGIATLQPTVTPWDSSSGSTSQSPGKLVVVSSEMVHDGEGELRPWCKQWFPTEQRCNLPEVQKHCRWDGKTCSNKVPFDLLYHTCYDTSKGKDLREGTCKLEKKWKQLSVDAGKSDHWAYTPWKNSGCEFNPNTQKIECQREKQCAAGWQHGQRFHMVMNEISNEVSGHQTFNCQTCAHAPQLQRNCCEECRRVESNPEQVGLTYKDVTCLGCNTSLSGHQGDTQVNCTWVQAPNVHLQCNAKQECETGIPKHPTKTVEQKNFTKVHQCKKVPCRDKCWENPADGSPKHDLQLLAGCCALCLENACAPNAKPQYCEGCGDYEYYFNNGQCPITTDESTLAVSFAPLSHSMQPASNEREAAPAAPAAPPAPVLWLLLGVGIGIVATVVLCCAHSCVSGGKFASYKSMRWDQDEDEGDCE